MEELVHIKPKEGTYKKVIQVCYMAMHGQLNKCQ